MNAHAQNMVRTTHFATFSFFRSMTLISFVFHCLLRITLVLGLMVKRDKGETLRMSCETIVDEIAQSARSATSGSDKCDVKM